MPTHSPGSTGRSQGKSPWSICRCQMQSYQTSCSAPLGCTRDSEAAARATWMEAAAAALGAEAAAVAPSAAVPHSVPSEAFGKR